MGSGPDNRVEVLAASLRREFVAEPSMAELSEDAMLVAAARDGDRVAFGCLYDRFARMVHGVLLAKVPTSEVEDLVQDVFMMALRRLSTVRDTSRFGAWLAAIARNRANDYHRRWGPEDRRPADEIREDAASNASRGDDDRATEILDAVKSLPDSYWETLILRLVEGMTGPEIAARTGMTHGSVRVNLHRGMQQLRARLRSNRNSDDPERETP